MAKARAKRMRLRIRCPVCNSTQIVYRVRAHDYLCRTCGRTHAQVLEEQVQEG